MSRDLVFLLKKKKAQKIRSRIESDTWKAELINQSSLCVFWSRTSD